VALNVAALLLETGRLCFDSESGDEPLMTFVPEKVNLRQTEQSAGFERFFS
jgi:hypothetical protein